MESPFQQLLDFIFSNIWIVIIIGGFILNTFKRFNAGESEPTTQIPFPKQFNPFDQEKKEVKEVYEERKFETHVDETPVSNSSNTFYEKYLELQEKNLYGETSPAVEEVIKPTKAKPTRPIQTEQQPVQAFSNNKVVEGIIWSEILGPPRAKKPIQRRNY
ncbi:hypothetical protein [Fredinandcohnia sp. 179-A 10B2 NHS]|uniref:hypothetical protein n=1 Tax=Fredinandcohnia sp. 179-A 10B2 NHS TaxID=3235176 RepID=UPI0039A237BE